MFPSAGQGSSRQGAAKGWQLPCAIGRHRCGWPDASSATIENISLPLAEHSSLHMLTLRCHMRRAGAVVRDSAAVLVPTSTEQQDTLCQALSVREQSPQGCRALTALMCFRDHCLAKSSLLHSCRCSHVAGFPCLVYVSKAVAHTSSTSSLARRSRMRS